MENFLLAEKIRGINPAEETNKFSLYHLIPTTYINTWHRANPQGTLAIWMDKWMDGLVTHDQDRNAALEHFLTFTSSKVFIKSHMDHGTKVRRAD